MREPRVVVRRHLTWRRRSIRAIALSVFTGLVAIIVSVSVDGVFSPSEAHALPIKLRARAQFVDVRAARHHDAFRLRGRLVDDQRRPVRRRTVDVTVSGAMPMAAITEEDGRFEVPLPVAAIRDARETGAARLSWFASFGGDAEYGAARKSGTADLRREPTWLSMEISPERAVRDDKVVTIRVSVRSETGPVPEVPIQIQIANGPELYGESNPGGVTTFLVRPALLGPPGKYFVACRFGGDPRYSASTVDGVLRIVGLTRVTLRVGREGSAAMGRYRFSGRVSDASGPVANAKVAIAVEPYAAGATMSLEAIRLITMTRTDADGIYLAAVPARVLFKGQRGLIALVATLRPDGATYQSASSAPVRIDVPSPPGVPARWYLIGLAWVFGLLTMVQLVRLRIWQRLTTALRRRRLRRHRPEPEEHTFVIRKAEQAATTRSDWLSGKVVDSHTLLGLEDLGIKLEAPHGEVHEIRSDSGGGFEFGPLTPGVWQLEIGATGYMARSKSIEAPHDGGWDGATFGLVSIRQYVRHKFADALGRLGARWRWGYDTVRDGVAAAAVTDPLPKEVSVLQSLVEMGWYTPQGLTRAALEKASADSKASGEVTS